MLPPITFLPENTDMLSFVESVAQSAAINTQDLAFPLSCESVGTLHFSRTVLKNTMALHLPCFETCLLPDQEKRNACLQKVCIKEKKKVKLLTFNMCISSGFFLFFFFFSTQNLRSKCESNSSLVSQP